MQIKMEVVSMCARLDKPNQLDLHTPSMQAI